MEYSGSGRDSSAAALHGSTTTPPAGAFVDPTPRNDSEFTLRGNQGEQHRMDLLTVLEHEIGHLLGKEHERTGAMVDTLSAGTRRTPSGTLTSAPSVSWFGGIGKKKDGHFAVWLGATGEESI